MLAAFAALAAGGSVNVYSGVQPTNSDTAITTQIELVSFGLGTPAFAAASGGVMAANAITPSVAIATGGAAWFRIFASDGVTAIMDGSVGTASCDLNLATTTITSGDIIGVTSFTLSMPLN
jgi:hypothetical protein